MNRFHTKLSRALGAVVAVVGSALSGSAGAQALSDELQIVLPSGTMTYTATDPTSGFESILAFANQTGGTQSTDDYSATLSPTFVGTSGSTSTFNSSGATAWFNHQKTTTTFRETGLTEPGSAAVSDILLSFMATGSKGSTVNAVALISDPTLVLDILAINAPTATIPETGALQNVTSLVFPTSAPFTVNVLSAVPEASCWILLICGLGVVAFAYRRPPL